MSKNNILIGITEDGFLIDLDYALDLEMEDSQMTGARGVRTVSGMTVNEQRNVDSLGM